mgnify:CR=1 FL=1
MSLAVVASAGVGGGLFASVDLNLHDDDNDGKVRFQELANNFDIGPIYIFDVAGKVDAFLETYIKIEAGPITILDERFEIARVTLLDFELERPDVTPRLASQNGGVLTLHSGARAGDRQFGNTADGDETFRILAGDADGTVVVDAFGVKKTSAGVTRSEADGGAGN